jgi:hypothetical protein
LIRRTWWRRRSIDQIEPHESQEEQKLRKVIRARPEKEVEIREAFETLLIATDIEYTREKETVPYSTKSCKPDFVTSCIDLAIEIKLCHKDTREKEIIGEINDDIQAYGQKWSNLLFIVYDTGFIREVDVFRGSFEKHPHRAQGGKALVGARAGREKRICQARRLGRSRDREGDSGLPIDIRVILKTDVSAPLTA